MAQAGLFPGGRRAAVSLSYDDGYPQHLDHAIPDLEAAGLRATFYLHTGPAAPTLHARFAEWRAALARGHELGNHTRHHPCGSAEHKWVKPQFALENYDLARIERELREAGADLTRLAGAAAVTSYAYTCCQDWVGPGRTSYRPVVRRLFPAGRGGGHKQLAVPGSFDFAFIPAWLVESNVTLAELELFLDDAIRGRAWAVLTFHGIDGGHPINISRELHCQICRAIVARADELACDTVLNIASHLLALPPA